MYHRQGEFEMICIMSTTRAKGIPPGCFPACFVKRGFDPPPLETRYFLSMQPEIAVGNTGGNTVSFSESQVYFTLPPPD